VVPWEGDGGAVVLRAWWCEFDSCTGEEAQFAISLIRGMGRVES
jgi:hypothetical protein